MTAIPHHEHESERLSVAHAGPAYNAYRLLQFAFVVIPILAGVDKFTDVLCNWDKYLAPVGSRILAGHVHPFMMVVGVIEIIAGIGMALKPKYFSYIVAIWLFLIIINLLVAGTNFDIVLRDFGLLLAACALGRLAGTFDHGNFGGLLTHRV